MISKTSIPDIFIDHIEYKIKKGTFMSNANIEETRHQLEYMEQLHKMIEEKVQQTGKRPTYKVVNFGCQMNAKDAEKLAGILNKIGYVEAETEEADFVLYNTCTVRENANLKVYGRLGHLKTLKKKNPDMLIALCGCMMQEQEVVDKIKESYRFVDIIFGTHNIFKFAELLKARLDSGEMIIDIWKDTTEIVEDLPAERKYSFKCGVNIMYGCNNFCTYCIVPYVRGRERSREIADIVREVEDLVADGVVEIMLLGQNVNSYGKTLEPKVSFADLLKELEKVEGLERIRFMTPHPKDITDDFIEVLANSKKICNHLHLPLQSGSTRLLKKMNRHYTKERYLEIVNQVRERIPNIAITTDIIVGFPGETEEDFLETMDVVEKAQYDGAFTFIYSKRTGTPAAVMPDQVPEDVVKERFDRLLARVQEISSKSHGQLQGTTQTVLIEEVNHQDPSMVTGRLTNNTTVHLKGNEKMIGKIFRVNLVESKGFYYIGELAE